MKTTLNAIRSHSPCREGWTKLLRHLGKTEADDAPLPIVTVLDSNGLDDALWCLRAVTGHDREIRLFAVWCARQVQHLMTDPRSIAALDVAERFANGEASREELDDARTAAYDAAYAATRTTATRTTATRTTATRTTATRTTAARTAAARTADADAAYDAAYAAYAAAYAAYAAASDAAARAAQEKELRRVCAAVEQKGE